MTTSRRGERTGWARWRAAILAVILAGVAAGCGNGGATDPPPLGPVADADMSLTANNQSDRPLELYVNGGKLADIPPKTELTIQAKDIQPMPWTAELRLTTGRTLLSLIVASGSVVRRAEGSQSVGSRVDLSCGRIELYAVIPLGGPAPGQGHPGDCGP